MVDENIVDKKISEIIELLRKEKPDVGIALKHSTPLELLIATILSAQCTDRRVNEVTKKLLCSDCILNLLCPPAFTFG